MPDARSFVLGVSNFLLGMVYPLMKRVTHWPQVVLGVTYNGGIPLAWSAMHGSLHLPAVLPMYLAGVAWTVHYDTIYAHQDRLDDIKHGVKSTAVLFGDDTKRYLTGFSALTVAGLAVTGATANLSWPYYASLAYTAGHFAWQVSTMDLANADDCMDKFIANQVAHLYILLSFVLFLLFL
jgi:4-hydroxybenzoate polyprenyltransferase